MRAEGRAEQVMGVGDVGHPVADGLVDGIFQGPAAAVHRAHFGSQQLHAQHVRILARDIDRAHIDHTVQAQQCGGGRRSDPMLAGPGLGDQAALAHPLGQQGLPEGVVDLMSPGVSQVLALKVDLRPVQV
jgi:hypothetical protein